MTSGLSEVMGCYLTAPGDSVLSEVRANLGRAGNFLSRKKGMDIRGERMNKG